MADIADNLFTLGFVFVKSPKIPAALRLELAIREFQTYAKLSATAQVDQTADPKLPLADRLKSIDLPATHRYKGNVNGAETPETKSLVETWVGQHYHCPVVVECWPSKRITRKDGTKWVVRRETSSAPTGGGENLWLWDEAKALNAPSKGRRMFVRDFTRRYDQDPAYQRLLDEKKRLLLGRHNLDVGQDGPISDPLSWEVDALITPERLTGKPYAALTPEAQITYRVVRAMSEAECGGYFDTVNCWDKALVSIGPCHWTIAHPDGAKFALGELEAFLAYAKSLDPNLLKLITGDSGIEPNNPWFSAADESILNKGQRKYESRFSQWVMAGAAEKRAPVPNDKNRLNFFRSWHWFYRFQTATRISGKFQAAMWDMARFRLRDILSAPAGLGIKNGQGQDATLQDVFTSECSVVRLMEWHVYKPGNIFDGGKPTELLSNAIKSSGVKLNVKTSDWKDDQERQLIKALKEVSPAIVSERFEQAADCDQLLELPHPDPKKGLFALSAARHSFLLDQNIPGASPF